MKLAAVVILYNPSHAVLDNILSYQAMVGKLIVIDNSEQPDTALIDQLTVFSNAVVLCRYENTGISAALNAAAGLAIGEGYKWLLTMDQDSYFENKTLQKYINCIYSVYHSSDIGMLGVNYDKPSLQTEEGCIIEDAEILITSGSVVNLGIFQKLGGFDEELFIDEVDSEYCYRLRESGYKVCKVQNVFLQHELGKMITVRNWFLGPVVQRNVHSPVRIYYMIRNFLYVYFRYKSKFRKELLRNLQIILNRVKNAVLYSSGKRIKILYYIFLGVKDFSLKKYGKKK